MRNIFTYRFGLFRSKYEIFADIYIFWYLNVLNLLRRFDEGNGLKEGLNMLNMLKIENNIYLIHFQQFQGFQISNNDLFFPKTSRWGWRCVFQFT